MRERESGNARTRELALQRVLVAWIVTGLVFMLLPGTFLGVWNLLAIAGEHSANQVDPSWIQAHGHAQIFGWIGSFILGIGFYSLSKIGRVPVNASTRAWVSWTLWTAGVTARWVANVWQWQWRWLLPLSALLELLGYGLFFWTVSRHRPATSSSEPVASERPTWIIAVGLGSVGFILALLANLELTLQNAIHGATPAIPHAANQRLLVLFTWAFPVVTIWGFSARWLPVFLGLREPMARVLLVAVGLSVLGTAAAVYGHWEAATIALLMASIVAAVSLRVLRPSVKPPKTGGVHPWFPAFVRLAYVWLMLSATVAVAAAFWDRAGGLWGSSRHALTVGFISAMVFSIGQRVLPGFSGRGALFSPRLMLWSITLLNLGCALRVSAEIGAYESYAPFLWPLLPVSAITEMLAVTLFAGNLLLTLRRIPVHVQAAERSGWHLTAS